LSLSLSLLRREDKCWPGFFVDDLLLLKEGRMTIMGSISALARSFTKTSRAAGVAICVAVLFAAPAQASWGWTGTLNMVYIQPDGSIVGSFTAGYTAAGTEPSPCGQPGTFMIQSTDKNIYALILSAYVAGKRVNAINDSTTAPCVSGYPALGRILVFNP
jgi:hypothetical protein